MIREENEKGGRSVYLYGIRLELNGAWDESWWNWEVEYGPKVIACGSAGYRWSAVRQAKKAARRHAKGLDPVKLPRVKPNEFMYRVVVED